MTKITKEIKTSQLPEKCKWILSNWKEFNCYRSTLVAYLNRGYYLWVDDKITWAYLKT